MRRRRHKASEPAFSLFSFLDTLMCTLGALILLLVTMSLKIRPDQQTLSLEELMRPRVKAAVAPEPEPEPQPVESPVPASPVYTQADRDRDLAERAARRAERQAEWSRVVASARAARDRQQAELTARRQTLADAERDLREAQARAAAATDQAEAAKKARKTALAAEKKLQGQEEQVIEQIAATRRNLDLESRKQAALPNEFAIVPYDGTSGTMRRPIYIECTRHGYRFLPENEFVGPEHLDGFTESYNPLLTGTQALLRYWSARRRESRDEPEPYVLLLVRPSGSLSYYLARKLLAPLGAHFGYELVEEDWKLALPDPDPGAQTALRDALEITVEARERVRESLAGEKDRGGPFAFNNNHRALSRGEVNEAFGPEARRGRGGRDGAGDWGDRPRGRGDSAGGLSERSPEEAVDDLRGGDRASLDRRSRGERARDERGTGGGFGRGRRAVAANLSGRPAEDRAGAGEAGGRGAGELSAARPGTGDGANSEGRGRGWSNPTRRGARPATIGGFGADPADGEPVESTEGTRGGRAFGAGPSGEASDGGEAPPLVPLPDEIAPSRGNVPRARQIPPTTSGRFPAPDSTAPNHGFGAPNRGFGGSDDETDRGATPGDSAQLARSGGQAGKVSRLRAGSPSGNGASGEPPNGPPSFGQSGGGDSGATPPPGGKKRWGQSPTRSGIGLERKVEIHIKADRLLIGPNDATIPAGRGEKPEELLQSVLGGIEQTAQSWGAPPANFYWLPAVKFVVHPGGSPYYERLRGPLEKWGVRSTLEYAPASSAAGNRGGPRQ